MDIIGIFVIDTWLVVLFLFVILFLYNLIFYRSPAQRGEDGEKQVLRYLEKRDLPALHSLIVQGRHSFTEVDVVALVGDTILVIEVKNWGGTFYGEAHERYWRRMVGRKATRVFNPLAQNQGHLRAMRHAFPEGRYEGITILLGQARFPRGRPSEALTWREAKRRISDLQLTPTSLAQSATWQRIAAHAETAPPEWRERHLEYVKRLQARDDHRGWD